MPLDSVFLSGLAGELSETITGAKIDKVQQPERDLLLLSLRMPGGNGKLLINGGVGSARVHLTQGKFENPAEPPMFCMLLRKHLIGARIERVEQPHDERLLMLHLDARDEMGVNVSKCLVVEMMGRQSNVILTGADDIIIDCMRRVDPSMSELRPILPGMRYRLPPRPDKPTLFDLDAETRAELVARAEPGAALDSWLLRTFSGLSPLICRELCYRALGDASPRLDELDAEQQGRLCAALDALCYTVNAGNLEPVLLCEGEKLRDFTYLAVEQYGSAVSCQARDSFSELLDEFYLRRDKAESMRRRSQSLQKSMKTLRDRTAKKLALQREELRRSEDRETLRRRADLITANLYRVRKGDRVLRTEDFYDPDMPTVEIPLDALKTPQENAAALYKQYRKAKTAEQHLNVLIAEGEKNLQYLNSVLDEIARAETERDLSEIRQELCETGFLRPERGKRKQKSAPSAPLRFVSDAGFEILVGRSNMQNDTLTHRTARRTDLWLHVQKIHGSHVIIRCMDTTPDAQTVAQAASLAVYYSQGRDGGKIPVDVTQVRHVRKSPGGLPGMVLYTDYQTVIAEADEALVKRLQRS